MKLAFFGYDDQLKMSLNVFFEVDANCNLWRLSDQDKTPMFPIRKVSNIADAMQEVKRSAMDQAKDMGITCFKIDYVREILKGEYV